MVIEKYESALNEDASGLKQDLVENISRLSRCISRRKNSY
jgi:hypothetical protein